MRMSDWSSDVCASDLRRSRRTVVGAPAYSRTRPLVCPMLKPPNSRKSRHRGEQSLQNTRPCLRPFSGTNRGPNGKGMARGSHLIVHRNKLYVNYEHRTEERRIGTDCVRPIENRGT